MCFSNEADWYARISDIVFAKAESQCKCNECRRTINAGEWREHVYQQEHEECQLCEFDECEGTHDYGETYEGDTCRECCLLLAAIYDLEAQEGCPEYSRQPLGGMLQEELWQDRRYGENKYIPYALSKYPELAIHKLCR